MAFARVAMPVGAWQLFDYWVPGGLDVGRGDVVRARLGNRLLVGVVVRTDDASDVDASLQPIESMAGVPRLPGEVVALADFVASYYQSPPGLAHALLVPPIVRARKRGVDPAPHDGASHAEAAARLNDAQSAALDTILASDAFGVTMLHGVTGSGKTNVYLAAAQRCVARGGQVLILVPEINLTPQFARRVADALAGARSVSLHSGLAAGERRANWEAAARGDADIVLATRLGVFAPLPRLALIIVDEEHDDSFRQQDGVRYHARDLAIWRARQRDVPIVLGSATPSLETWAHARRRRYAVATLPSRADPRARLPSIRFVPNRGDDVREGIGDALRQAMTARLARREQSLLFVNRRGYSPSLKCTACSWESHCERCAARLVVHRAPDRLRCHHCGHARVPPRGCPDCGNVDLLPHGFGTQRLEQVLRATFPSARIARVDRDSTRGREAFAKMREAIEALDVDILIGTQMLAKGHDFERLTLVGVLGADNALYSADFRATERLAALLMQVSGRAGRAERPGEVIVQTDFPDHPVYRALASHDYARFADELVRERSAAELPPATRIALLVAEAHESSDVARFLDEAYAEAKRLCETHRDVEAFAPVPAAMPRRRGYERAHVLVQSHARSALQAFLPAWREAIVQAARSRVRYALDVDPTSF
jgi:primosomal protein N' (replication factor Y) (superfamily II helicase)